MNYLTYILISFFVSMISFGVSVAEAAELRFDSSNKEISRMEEFAVDLLIDTQGDIVNAIQAEIHYPKDILKLIGIHDGNSIASLWIEKAKDTDGKITFSGLIPGGFNGLIDPLSYPKIYPGNVLKLIFKGEIKGIGEIKIVNQHILKSDGKGTEVVTTVKPMTVSVTQYSLDQKYEFKDIVSPEFESISIEKRGSVFKNKRGLVFLANDKETGVKEYYIKIGDEKWVPTVSPFELKDYLTDKKINIKAVDHAGNEKVAEILLPAVANLLEQVLIVIILFGVFLLLVIIGRKSYPQEIHR